MYTTRFCVSPVTHTSLQHFGKYSGYVYCNHFQIAKRPMCKLNIMRFFIFTCTTLEKSHMTS